MGNKPDRKQKETQSANQTVMSCHCHSRYTHPFMAEYLTLSCQVQWTMDTINRVFKLVNNLKYYLKTDPVMVFPEKHQSKY